MDAPVRNPDAHTHTSAGKGHQELTHQPGLTHPPAPLWEESSEETQGNSRELTEKRSVLAGRRALSVLRLWRRIGLSRPTRLFSLLIFFRGQQPQAKVYSNTAL